MRLEQRIAELEAENERLRREYERRGRCLDDTTLDYVNLKAAAGKVVDHIDAKYDSPDPDSDPLVHKVDQLRKVMEKK